MASRARKGREAKYDAPGEVGRLTGTVMPTNVPLNEDGAEDFEAFFTSPKSQAVSTKSSTKKKNAKTPASTKEAKRRQARPDKAHQLGEVGRVTGKVIRGAPRNSEGVEDIDAFYKSPTEGGTTGKKSFAVESRRVSTMSMASSVGVARRESPSYRARRETEYGEQFEQQTLDMEVDDESGLSPRSYMQSKNASRSRQSGVTTFSTSPPLAASKSRPSTNTINDFSDPEADEPEPHHPGDLSAISQLPSSPSYSDNEPLPDLPPPSPPLPNNEQLMQDLDEFDHDFAGPMDDLNAGPAEDDGGLEVIQEEDEEEAEQPVEDKENKKGEGKASTVSPKAKQARKKRKWESEEPEGVRKSTRRKMEPLEYWRNERIVYARRDSGPQPHYGIKEVLHPKKPEHKSLVSKKRSGSRARSVKAEEEEVNGDFEGWDDATDPEGLVWDYVKHEETKRRIAFTSKMIATKTAGKQSFRFQKVFTDGDFMAGGILEIPVNEKKPLKPARDNSYILYVVKGAVRALVYRTTFTIAKGGFFLVPRGNSYEIENIGSTDAQIVFLQGREIRVTEEVAPEE